MGGLQAYKDQFFSFNNPVFFALILSTAIIIILVIIFIKVIYPLQKKFVAENQRYLLERAELMALFAEMDPDPLLRVNYKGEIVHTNESSRKIFKNFDLAKANIKDIIPAYQNIVEVQSASFTETIEGKVYTVNVKNETKLGFSNFYLHDITTIKEYENKLENYQKNLIALSAELDRRYEELKSDLSSELHDDLGQKMIVLKLKIGKLANHETKDIIQDLEGVYQRIREISHTLAPLNISNLGIELSIQSIVQNITQASGIKGKLEIFKEYDNIDTALEPGVEQCIIYTVQEALNNIVKHSHAKEFLITITYEDVQIIVVISDDGIGIKEDFSNFTVSSNKGIGLFRMKERIKNLGGEFLVTATADYNCNIIAKIPRGTGYAEKNKTPNS